MWGNYRLEKLIIPLYLASRISALQFPLLGTQADLVWKLAMGFVDLGSDIGPLMF